MAPSVKKKTKRLSQYNNHSMYSILYVCIYIYKCYIIIINNNNRRTRKEIRRKRIFRLIDTYRHGTILQSDERVGDPTV